MLMKQQSIDQMGAIRHLVEKAGWYHSRLVVPVPLRDIVGKKELWTALDTMCRSEANDLLPAALAKQKATLAAARATLAEASRWSGQSETKFRRERLLTARQVAIAHYSRELETDDRTRNAGHYNADWRDWSKTGCAKGLQRVASGTAPDDECDAIIGWAIDVFVADGNLKAQRGTPEWRAFARQLAAIQLEVEKRKDDRDRGEGDGMPSHPLLALSPKVDANETVTGEGGKTLAQILPEYMKERRATARTDYDSETTVRMFDECMGEAKAVGAITKADVRTFKRMLQDLPVNYRKLFRGQTVPEAIKANQAQAAPCKTLHVRTINDKYLSKLHPILGWCQRNDIIPNNPASGVKVDSVPDNGEDNRKDFSPGDIAKIFAAPLFDPSVPYGEKQWALLVALFTGARAGESAQIKLDNIQPLHECLCITIEGKTKNRSSNRRVIPVHSTLLSLGFEKRVADLSAKGATHFFPEWFAISAKSQRYERFIPRWFNERLKCQLGIADKLKVFHSLRHNFTTALDQAGVPMDIQERLCGHAKRTPHMGYVHSAPITAMKEAIEKLRYDGFNLGVGL